MSKRKYDVLDLPPSGTHVKTDILINGTDITRLPSSLHPSACGLSDMQVASSLPISFSLLGVVDDDIFSHILTFAGPPTPLLPVSRRFVPHPVEMKYLVVECEYADEWGAALIPGEDVDMIIGGAPRDDPFIRCCSMCDGVADVGIARVGNPRLADISRFATHPEPHCFRRLHRRSNDYGKHAVVQQLQ